MNATEKDLVKKEDQKDQFKEKEKSDYQKFREGWDRIFKKRKTKKK